MSQPQLAVVMDPIGSINPKKDSTLAMLLAAQARGFGLVYLQQKGLRLRSGQAWASGHRISVQDDERSWHEIGEAWEGPLGNVDVVLMRKDPPFDMEYIYSTYILDFAAAAGALVCNPPNTLRDLNEKAATAWLPGCTPPSLISRSHDEIKAFLAEHGKIVVKPLDGMGGRGIFVINDGDLNTNVVLETMTEYGTRFALAQRYLPEIKEGDKRILLVDGEPIPYRLARIPPPDDNRGNLVVGAKGVAQALSARDHEIAKEVGEFLKERGVLFAGIDVIGDFLTEVNVTSPTGIRELDRAFDLDIAGQLIDTLLERLR